MIDGRLDDLEAALQELGGEEAVHAVEGNEVINGFPAEGLEGTSGIAEAVLDEQAANGVGKFGSPAARGGILALGTVAANDVRFVAESVDEGRNVGGIVLSVAIDEDDDGAAGIARSGIHGGGLAAVAGKLEGGHPGHRGDDLPGLVRAAIVDREDLGPGIGRNDLLEDGPGGFLFVVKRNDDADL